MQRDIPRHTVRVVYTEPEFQRRTPNAPKEYHFDYRDIPAVSPDLAIEWAIRQFWGLARLSRVSWRRCIQRVVIIEGTHAGAYREVPGPRDDS